MTVLFESAWGGRAEPVSAEALPDAFRRLLDHGRSMTATLAARWDRAISAEVLRQEISPDGGAFHRFTTLVADPERLPVELAALRLPLATLDESVRRRLIETTEPFGGILTGAGITFRSEPVAFLRLTATAPVARAAAVSRGITLYGRVARLLRGDGTALGETMEMLPRA